MVVMAGVLVLALGALAVADLGSMVASRARAQAAAEAAALAAAVHQAPILGQEGDPVAAARDYAGRNGATLLRCECAEGRADAVVEVALTPPVLFLRGWAGRRVRAVARAELNPLLFTFRASPDEPAAGPPGSG